MFCKLYIIIVSMLLSLLLIVEYNFLNCKRKTWHVADLLLFNISKENVVSCKFTKKLLFWRMKYPIFLYYDEIIHTMKRCIRSWEPETRLPIIARHEHKWSLFCFHVLSSGLLPMPRFVVILASLVLHDI